jgi:hypothetical protein
VLFQIIQESGKVATSAGFDRPALLVGNLLLL